MAKKKTDWWRATQYPTWWRVGMSANLSVDEVMALQNADIKERIRLFKKLWTDGRFFFDGVTTMVKDGIDDPEITDVMTGDIEVFM